MSNDDWQIVPQRDEALARNRAANSRPAQEPRRPQSGGKSPDDTSRRSGGRTTLVLVLLLLVSFGASAYLFVELQQMHESQQALQGRLASVEGKLSVTDESLSQSGAAIQALLKEHDERLLFQMSEIRKLWGVSYDTNRRNIETLQAETGNLTRRIDEASTKLGRLDTAPEDIAQIKDRIEATGSQLLIMKADVEDALSRMRTTRDELNALTRNLAGIQGDSQDYAEAIRSIDAFRMQINQRMIQLENEVRSLSAPR